MPKIIEERHCPTAEELVTALSPDDTPILNERKSPETRALAEMPHH